MLIEPIFVEISKQYVTVYSNIKKEAVYEFR